jgi:hypothetical protein
MNVLNLKALIKHPDEFDGINQIACALFKNEFQYIYDALLAIGLDSNKQGFQLGRKQVLIFASSARLKMSFYSQQIGPTHPAASLVNECFTLFYQLERISALIGNLTERVPILQVFKILGYGPDYRVSDQVRKKEMDEHDLRMWKMANRYDLELLDETKARLLLKGLSPSYGYQFT